LKPPEEPPVIRKHAGLTVLEALPDAQAEDFRSWDLQAVGTRTAERGQGDGLSTRSKTIKWKGR